VSRTGSRTFTPREAQVLELVAQGLSNGQLARQLGVTVHAVKFHLSSIYRKLGVSNRTEAAGLYFRLLAPQPLSASPVEDGRRFEEPPLPTVWERRALVDASAVETGDGSERERV